MLAFQGEKLAPKALEYSAIVAGMILLGRADGMYILNIEIGG